MMQPELQEEKKSFFDRLPKLGRASLFLLALGIFLVFFIPMMLVYRQQTALQMGYRQELSNLQVILATPATEKERLAAENARAEAELAIAQELLLNSEQNIAIVEGLLDLAERSDIAVISLETTQPKSEDQDPDYPFLTYLISLQGQVPKFQNFLLALDQDARFKYSRVNIEEVNTIIFEIAEDEGDEDVATLELRVSFTKEES